jgi:uncharacterized damage-inducible protein DinB
LTWKPTDGALSLGQLVRHILHAEMAWQQIIKGEWDLKRFLEIRKDLDLVEATGPVSSLENELTSLDLAHRETLDLIASCSETDLTRTFNGSKGRVTMYDVVLGLCEHEAHHRGQIVAYLKLLGIERPSPWRF